MLRGAAAGVILGLTGALTTAPGPVVERVTTVTPYPRGLAIVNDELYVLARGRVRGGAADGGGVRGDLDDEAGTIFVVDPQTTEPASIRPPGATVRANGRVFAHPTEPPFRLFDRTAEPPSSDDRTDRPYCTLRHHPETHSFYICAFSGIDKPQTKSDPVAFRKNRSDAVLRFDTRTGTWSEVDRRDANADDPLDGPDNCLPVGTGLYVAAKESSRLIWYDLSAWTEDAGAPATPGEVVLRDVVTLEDGSSLRFDGHSALAVRDGWLYVGARTTSCIIRLPLDPRGRLIADAPAQLIARFDPYDPVTHRSANLTDITFDSAGRLYAIGASPARIHRIDPNPERVYDGTLSGVAPWMDLERVLGRAVKAENILASDDWLYVTTGDGYAAEYADDDVEAAGTVYRIRTQRAQ